MAPRSKVLLAFGGNEAGPWGDPRAAIERSFTELEGAGVALQRVSGLSITRPVGPEPQPDFVNAAALAVTMLDPIDLLALLKRLERDAGRRPGPRWGPRPLDIDIIDFAGRIVGWEHPHDPMRPTELVLPHPELHQRTFVLEPLREIAPDWRHPVFGLTPAELLSTLG